MPNLDEITRTGINPALALLPAKMDTPEARVIMLAIGLQESEFLYRFQLTKSGQKGPARSFWQCEQGGGVAGVLRHPLSEPFARELCAVRNCKAWPAVVWERIETDDVLAAGVARLLLYTDVGKLPLLGDSAGGWAYYLRVWRPGKPRPDEWPENYAKALAFVRASEA